MGMLFDDTAQQSNEIRIVTEKNIAIKNARIPLLAIHSLGCHPTTALGQQLSALSQLRL
jgi:hypothetical protein